MTHDHPSYAVTACDRGHVHCAFLNRKGEAVSTATMTARQAHDLAEELHAFAHEAEVVLANVPGIAGGDQPACA